MFMKELNDEELSLVNGGLDYNYREPNPQELKWILRHQQIVKEKKEAWAKAAPQDRENAKQDFVDSRNTLFNFVYGRNIDPKYATYR